jgi:L-threonylcarbamoyladenylate synthase
MAKPVLKTRLIRVNSQHPEDSKLSWPASLLRQGGLVAFPTETVYGLGADACNQQAVAALFAVKGRPPDNPLIVHIAGREQLDRLVTRVPALALALLDAFAPGPLTLVLPRSTAVSDLITAGLDTVAVRMPAHPVARRLIELAGVPLAAPSANRSGRPSPTRAWHVRQDLDGLIPCIIDGGPCQYGLESTVVDVTGERPVILRPGSITADEIRAVTGLAPACDRPGHSGAATAVRSPGMKYRHYAPRAHIRIATGESADRRLFEMQSLLDACSGAGVCCAVYASGRLVDRLDRPLQPVSRGQINRPGGIGRAPPADFYPVWIYAADPDAAAAGRDLFDALRTFDDLGVAEILVEGLPDDNAGAAYMNRLRKASGQDSREEIDMAHEIAHTPEAATPEHVAKQPDTTVLFVCTGNTCRSPMAAALFNRQPDPAGLTADSAGLAAIVDDPATAEAVRVMREQYGVDLSGHRARPVTADLLKQACRIATMTAMQRDLLRRAYPDLAGRIATLGELAGVPAHDVADPYGNSGAYQATAAELARLIERMRLILAADFACRPKTSE